MTEVYVMDYEVLSPIGTFAEEHLTGLRTGRSGGAAITQFDAAGFPVRFACEVKGDLGDIAKVIHPDIRAMFPYDRKAELFCCCLERIRQRAGSRFARIAKERIGVFVGAGLEALPPISTVPMRRRHFELPDEERDRALHDRSAFGVGRYR